MTLQSETHRPWKAGRLTLVLVVAILTASCGSDARVTAPALEPTPTTQPTVAVVPTATQAPTATTVPTATPEPDLRSSYIADLGSAIGGAPGFDADCLAVGIVDAVGVDSFAAAGVEPEELGSINSLADEGIEITPALREEIHALFDRCIDGSVMLAELLPELFPDFPPEIGDCLAESLAPFMTSAVADLFIDESGEFGPEMLGDIAPVAAECREELAPVPGADVTWADGEDAFVDALVAQFTFIPFEGAIALPEGEARCFASAAVELLGAQLDAHGAVSADEFSSYLGALLAPGDIGLTIDDATARSMATADLDCVDRARVTAESMVVGMSGLIELDEGDTDSLVVCINESISPELWYESQRLQYLHGADLYTLPEAGPLLDLFAVVGETCTLELLE